MRCRPAPAARPASPLQAVQAVLLLVLLGGLAPGRAHTAAATAATTASTTITASMSTARFENSSRVFKGTRLAATSTNLLFGWQVTRTGTGLPSKSAPLGPQVTQAGAPLPGKSTTVSLQSAQAGAASTTKVNVQVTRAGAAGSSTPTPMLSTAQAGGLLPGKPTPSSSQVTQMVGALQSKPTQSPQATAAMPAKSTPGLQAATQAGATKLIPLGAEPTQQALQAKSTPFSTDTAQAVATAPAKPTPSSMEAASAGATYPSKSTPFSLEATQAAAMVPAKSTSVSVETTQASSALSSKPTTSSTDSAQAGTVSTSNPATPSTSDPPGASASTPVAPPLKSTVLGLDSTESGAAEESSASTSPSSVVVTGASAGGVLGRMHIQDGEVAAAAEEATATAAPSAPAAPKVASRAMVSEWEEFKKRNNRSYYSRADLGRMARMYRGLNMTIDMHSDEDRMNMFMARKASIDDFNRNSRTFRRAINQFADLTPQEVVKRHTGLLLSKRKPRGSEYDFSRVMGRQMQHLPTAFDWRDRGAVTEPRNQASCGCCWAFAATAVMEAKNFIRNKVLVALSEQNLLDCDTLNEKCDGGTPWDAFDWIQSNGGQEENEKYPYEVLPDKCRQEPSRLVKLQVRGYMIVRPAVEENVMGALLAEGPLTIAVNANPVTFQDYREGVYSDPDCTNGEDDLRHAVVLVGFGEDPQGGPFWTVRNSWGRDWGEGGYIRISRTNNLCGVMTYAVFPSVD